MNSLQTRGVKTNGTLVFTRHDMEHCFCYEVVEENTRVLSIEYLNHLSTDYFSLFIVMIVVLFCNY